MAFSKVHEIEVDSSFRLSNSISTTNFEYQFPFTWPYPLEKCQLRLIGVSIPDSFYRFPATNLTVLDSTGADVVGSPLTDLLRVGTYTAAQIVTLFNQGFNTLGLAGVLICAYDSTQQKFSFQNTALTLYVVQSAWFPLMGLPGNSVTIPASTSVTFPLVGDLGEDLFNRLYIRLGTFENKIILPNIYNSFISYAVQLNDKNGRGYWYMGSSVNDNKQKLIISPQHLNNNGLLKVQLLRKDGLILDLNGRNWTFIVRVEPLDYADC